MKIISVPHAVLLKKAQEVKVVDAKTKALIAQMVTTLSGAKNPKGIGLAAPQVGETLRLFVIKIDKKSPLYVFINPEIISESDDIVDNKELFEGCLSIPKIWGPVKRHSSITVKYLDETGKETIKTFDGLMATIVQHETDHLNGILFTQRVLEQKAKLYQVEIGEEGKEEFKEIHI